MEPEKEQPKEEIQKKEGAFCKYNEATERCIFNPDSTASANDDECYKTDKSRCASKKKKMMKIIIAIFRIVIKFSALKFLRISVSQMSLCHFMILIFTNVLTVN